MDSKSKLKKKKNMQSALTEPPTTDPCFNISHLNVQRVNCNYWLASGSIHGLTSPLLHLNAFFSSLTFIGRLKEGCCQSPNGVVPKDTLSSKQFCVPYTSLSQRLMNFIARA